MDCPGFQVINYGIYDSRITLPRQVYSKSRAVARFELELVLEDLGAVSYIDGTAHRLEKGTFICGKPGQLRHSKLPLYCYYVHLLTDDPVLQPLLMGLPDACQLADPTALLQLFRELVAQPSIKKADNLQIAALVLRMLGLLRQQVSAADTQLGSSQRVMLANTEHYIRSHLDEELSLAQLSRRSGFSQAHFHRIFTGYFGKTPHEFVLSCRIEAAKAALRSDRCSLAELAASCGFSSQSHFSAQFKHFTGQTPLQYRKAVLSRLDP